MIHPLPAEKLQELRSLIDEELLIEEKLRLFRPRQVNSIRAIRTVERKLAAKKTPSESELFEMEAATDYLTGAYQKVNRPDPTGPHQPLPPMSPEARYARAESDALSGIEGFVSGLGLDERNTMLKAAGQPPISFELIHMQPPKPAGLVKLGFFATVAKSIKLWWQARKERKRQLSEFQAMLRKEYEALPPGELRDHQKAIGDLAIKHIKGK